MTNVQEWQQSNAERAFPFTESSRNADVSVALPYDFIVDLRVFPEFPEDNGVYLSTITYTLSTDTYNLVFRYLHNEQIAISGSVPRKDGAESRVGTKVLLENSPAGYSSYAIFTPGKKWDDGEPLDLWIMTDEYATHVDGVHTKNFPPESSTVDPNVILPGSTSLRRIFISSPAGIPGTSEWGMEVTQRIVQGFNVSLAEDPNDSDTIIISAAGGLGEGYYDDTEMGVVRYINNVYASGGANSLGLDTYDCLNHIDKPNTVYHDGDLADSITLQNTIQLLSDCIPCCGCSKYRAVSAAITRRSLKIKELCDMLASMILANQALYNDAVDRINASRKPIVRVRNIRVREADFTISVQNVCAVPVYAHIGMTITGGTVENGSFSLASGDSYMAHLNMDGFPALLATTKDYNNENPDLPSGLFNRFITGSDPEQGIKPIPPGGYSDLTFNYAVGSLTQEQAAIFDLRDTNLRIKFESNGMYGHQLTYGCKKDSYEVQVVPSGTVKRTNCSGTFSDEPTYKVIEVQP